MERREFFGHLIAGGATYSDKHRRDSRPRAKYHDEVVYRGPMAIPARIAGIVAEHPTIKKCRKGKLASRYAGDADSWVWIFRCQIPEHRLMIGEIVRTPEGRVRVHCWSTADPERYTRHQEPAQIVRPTPILPPLISPQPPPAPSEDPTTEYVDCH